jgi:hypothetical protein
MYLFDRWFPTCAPILKWFYRFTFLVVGFAIVTSAHMFLYVAEQLKFQIYLLCKNMVISLLWLSTVTMVYWSTTNTIKLQLKVELNFVLKDILNWSSTYLKVYHIVVLKLISVFTWCKQSSKVDSPICDHWNSHISELYILLFCIEYQNLFIHNRHYNSSIVKI